MLETIGISKLLTEKEISTALHLIFPSLKFIRVDNDTIVERKLKPNEVGFFVYPNDSEYKIRIEVMFPQKNNTEEREQYIAKKISENLNCKTIVGYQSKHSKDQYLSLVFENGKVFLADDLETKYAGDGDDEVRIIKELDSNMIGAFDNNGNEL
ncbi:MAG: hypothetical protein GYB31_09445 [Bacteroidetes bacterium]|nr:hypothetical protein [Bacteroidota bacterium]